MRFTFKFLIFLMHSAQVHIKHTYMLIIPHYNVCAMCVQCSYSRFEKKMHLKIISWYCADIYIACKEKYTKYSLGMYCGFNQLNAHWTHWLHWNIQYIRVKQQFFVHPPLSNGKKALPLPESFTKKTQRHAMPCGAAACGRPWPEVRPVYACLCAVCVRYVNKAPYTVTASTLFPFIRSGPSAGHPTHNKSQQRRVNWRLPRCCCCWYALRETDGNSVVDAHSTQTDVICSSSDQTNSFLLWCWIKSHSNIAVCQLKLRLRFGIWSRKIMIWYFR